MKNSGIILGSFVADSLSLGAHWIYDTDIIDKEFGRITTLQQPLTGSYHKTKKLGDFTHYGDQTLIVLQSIAEHGGFKLTSFATDWQEEMKSYRGYMDRATKQTLANLKAGKSLDECGSTSADLGGAARIAPLIYQYQNNWEKLVDAVQNQTKFTHNNATVLTGAEIIARICWEVMHGLRPTEALAMIVDGGISDMDLHLRLQQGLDSVNNTTRQAIADLGQACGISAGLPGVFHLVTKYEDDFATALIENVMAGGDSAARGLCVGMILGSYLGLDSVPKNWLQSMSQYEMISALIERIQVE